VEGALEAVGARLVLLIGDVNFACTIFFERQLFIMGDVLDTGDELYISFLSVLLLGQLTYASGIIFLGPKQQFRTVKVIQEMMIQYPEQFKTPRSSLTLDSGLDPSDSRSRKFGDSSIPLLQPLTRSSAVRPLVPI